MEVKMRSKKGVNLAQGVGAVLTLVLIAVLVIVAVYMFSSLGSTYTSPTLSIVNETGWLNSTGDRLTNASDCGFQSASISNIYNTSGIIIQPANYTLVNGILYNNTAIVWKDVNITYTYKNGGAVCTGASNTTVQFAKFPALVGLVGTIIFLGIVIGVLVASFTLGRSRGA
jgi:hypothetical protein